MKKTLITGTIILGTLGLMRTSDADSLRKKPLTNIIKRSDYTLRIHDVDEVRRQTDNGKPLGWSTYHTEKDGEIKEITYYDDGESTATKHITDFDLPKLTEEDKKLFKGLHKPKKYVRIFKDLQSNKKGYAVAAHHKSKRHYSIYYVEIHIPKDQKLH